MKLNDYQLQAMTYARFSSLDYPFAGLAEEAGEVLGKLAKAQRKWEMCQESVLENLSIAHFEPEAEKEKELLESLKKELGDTLWMIQACAHNLGLTLEEIAQDNIEKLSDRDARGVICGSGDNR